MWPQTLEQATEQAKKEFSELIPLYNNWFVFVQSESQTSESRGDNNDIHGKLLPSLDGIQQESIEYAALIYAALIKPDIEFCTSLQEFSYGVESMVRSLAGLPHYDYKPRRGEWPFGLRSDFTPEQRMAIDNASCWKRIAGTLDKIPSGKISVKSAKQLKSGAQQIYDSVRNHYVLLSMENPK